MEPEFWHKKWERDEIGFHVSEANPLLVNSFHAMALAKGSRIFLPLCGKTLDIAWLLAQGYEVVGIELNESAIGQLFTELGVEPEINSKGNFDHYCADKLDIFVGNFFDLTRDALGPVDLVYDRAALVALPEAMRNQYTRHLMQITGKAPQLLITYEYDQTEMDGPPFSVGGEEVKRHYHDHYQILLFDTVDVVGGFKGKHPASEHIWLLCGI